MQISYYKDFRFTKKAFGKVKTEAEAKAAYQQQLPFVQTELAKRLTHAKESFTSSIEPLLDYSWVKIDNYWGFRVKLSLNVTPKTRTLNIQDELTKILGGFFENMGKLTSGAKRFQGISDVTHTLYLDPIGQASAHWLNFARLQQQVHDIQRQIIAFQFKSDRPVNSSQPIGYYYVIGESLNHWLYNVNTYLAKINRQPLDINQYHDFMAKHNVIYNAQDKYINTNTWFEYKLDYVDTEYNLLQNILAVINRIGKDAFGNQWKNVKPDYHAAA